MSINNLLKPVSEVPAKWTNLNVNSIKANTIIGDGGLVVTGSAGPYDQEENPKIVSVNFAEPFDTVPKVSMTIKNMTEITAVPGPSISSVTTTGFDALINFGNYTPGFTKLTLDDTDTASEPQAIINVQGKPCTAYHASGTLQFVQSKTESGSSWNTPIIVDTFATFGVNLNLAIVDGNPAIAYSSVTSNETKFVRANDPFGNTWGTPVQIITPRADRLSLAVVNGNPAICYRELGTAILRYVRANDSIGSTWGSPVTVDASFSGTYSSLLVVDGLPAIAYSEDIINDLNYVRALDVNGATWDTPVPVDATTPDTITMIIVDGNPAIGYAAGGNVTYVRASDSVGSTWGTPVSVTSGSVPNLALIGSNPAFCYADAGAASSFNYVRATDTLGSTWDTPVIIDGKDEPIVQSFMVDIGDQPGMIYMATLDFSIMKYAYFAQLNYSMDYLASE